MKMTCHKPIVILMLLFLLASLGLCVNANTVIEHHNHVGRQLMSIDSVEMADNMQTLLRELPRFDFSFQKISNSFAPLEVDYYESLIILAAPFLIMGIISVLVGVLMMGCGVCCIAWFPRKKGGYSILERYTPSIVLFLFSLSLIVMMCVGVYSENAYNNSFYNAFNTVDNITVYELNLINSTLELINDYHGIGADAIHDAVPPNLDDWSNAVTNITHILQTLTDDIVFPIENVRHYIIFTGFGLVIVYAIIALIISVFRCGKCGYILMMMIFLCISLAWIFSSFNFFLSVFIADMCPVIEEDIADEFPSSISDYADFYLYCDGNSYLLFYPLPEAIDASILAAQIALQIDNSTLLQEELEQLQAMQTNMNSLLDCQPTSSALNTTLSLICVNLFDGLFAMTTMEIGSALILSVSAYMVILGIRRWNYPSRLTAPGDFQEYTLISDVQMTKEEHNDYSLDAPSDYSINNVPLLDFND